MSCNVKGQHYLVWIFILIGLTGCGAPKADPGELEIRVWDHREAIGDFEELILTVSKVGIHPAGRPRAEGWIDFKPSIQTLDLTQYLDGQQAVVVQATVEAVAYNGVRLTVDRAAGTLLNGQPVEVTVNFETVALDFQVRNGQKTVLGLDLVVLDFSDHPDQGYELHLREATVAQGNVN